MVVRESFRDLVQFEVDPAAAALLPREFCIDRRVAVLGPLPTVPGAPVNVAVADVHDERLLAELRERLGRPVHPAALHPAEIRQAIQLAHGGEGALDLSSKRSIHMGPQQRTSELLDDILSVAIQRQATDVHLEVFRGDVEVRLRIDGFLRPLETSLGPESARHVASRVKVLCGIDPTDRKAARDGHWSALYVDASAPSSAGRTLRRIDFRASVVPGPHGEDVVVRVLDPLRFRLDLATIGMSERTLERYRAIASCPSGLVLVAGPTVSGKTNTLYATLHALRERDLKIVTVEDPIEYEFARVNQKNVSPGMGFAPYVRAFLRQNPDVILVGEVRDRETAETVVQAATTGHLVVSTIHAKDAIGAVARLRALEVSGDALSSQLLALVGQRLVAKICEACKETCVPDDALIARFYDRRPVHSFWKGQGCEACEGTGYRGLTGVFELVEVRRDLALAIGRGDPLEALAEQVERSSEHVSLLADALEKVAAGITTLEEVARRLPPPRR